MKERLRPKNLILLFSVAGFLLSVTTSLWGATSSLIHLNESQILYLFSTSAQVLAGVYGLTLTGFIFLRNELSREELEDETLADVIDSLKHRYYSLLVFITALVLATFAISNLAISSESNGRNFLNAVLINSGQSLFAVSLVAIAYFIFDIASPGRIEAASRALQDIVDPTHTAPAKGSLEDFLRNYNQIETLLSDYGLSASLTSASYSGKLSRRPSNARLAEILARNERIPKELYMRVRDLITLRNSIIHGADPVVSQDLVETSREVLNELGTALKNEP